jgi:hypothetical protein
MFIREKRRQNKNGSVVTYLQLVESQRVEGRTRQRVLCTLGRTDDPKLASRLDAVVASASRYAEATALLVKEGMGVKTQTWGPQLVWERVWQETVGPIVKEALGHDQLARAAYLMVLHRLVDPGSKCAAFRFAQGVYGAGFDGLQLHDLYRALDRLAEEQEGMERAWFARHQDLFTQVDLVYFDTTSTYLEGRHPEDLAEFGYSRDHRSDRRQIAIGVVVTREGVPMAHLVLPGATADPVAFGEAITVLKQRLGMGRVILCCDRGMVTTRTLQALKEAKLEYVVATRMRKEARSRQALHHPGRYRKVQENLWVKEVTVPQDKDRYLLCFNPQAAEEDRRAREAIVNQLEKAIGAGSVRRLLRGAAKRYVRTPGDAPTLDRAAIEADARFDGKWVLRTNTELAAKEAALAYKGLWRVEQAFRTLKTPLELRPIYHWTEKRIRGHVMVCFLAFLMQTVLRKRLEAIGWEGSFVELAEGLNQVRAVILEGPGGQRFRLRDEIPACSMPAFHALNMAPPKRLQQLS